MCCYKKLHLYNVCWFPFWFFNYCISGLKAWLIFIGSWEASCMWLCLVHCLARIGSGGAADVLAAASRASPCGCRPGWPLASTKSTLGACNGGEFTATVAAVASFSTPWFRWVSSSHCLIYVLYDSMATAATVAVVWLYDNDLVMHWYSSCCVPSL
jgi:hypothetical protein